MENSQALLKFLKDNHNRYKENTCKTYQIAIKQFFKYCPFNIEEISRNHIQEYKIYLLSRMKESSVILKINALKAFYSYLFNEGIIATNPCLIISCPNIIESRPEIISKDVFYLMCEAAKCNLRDRGIIEMLSMGLRVSEVINIKKEYINWNRNTILILEAKEGKEKYILFSIECKKRLEKYLENRADKNPYLFVNHHKRQLTRQGVWKIVKKYAQMLLASTFGEILANNFTELLPVKI